MYDELTKVDLEKMQAEIDERIGRRPELIADVVTAREFGDLSENDEYKVAKREKNRNESRIRYLERMIRTAKVVEGASNGGGIGLFDKVTIYIEDDDEQEQVQLVTSMRQDAMVGRITRNSPVGKALWGRREGDRVLVEVNEACRYYIKIMSVEKGHDDDELPILPY